MEQLSSETLRIIDANLNRIGEGLRVLEEFARMTLNDREMSQQLKNLRHDTARCNPDIQQLLLQSRDSAGDVGAEMRVPGEGKNRNIPEIIRANSRRAQESLRVMEEIARLPGSGLDTENYQRARFEMYTIEKTLVSRILRRDKIQRLRGLYVIVDTAALKGRSHLEAARQAIRGGATVIQLRDKEHEKKEVLNIARQLADLCTGNNVLFIVNDSLDIALAADADGLHVGQEDLPVDVARRLLPIDKILGCSARTPETAMKAESDGADYLGVGSIYPTASKEVTVVVGPECLRKIKQAVDLPLVAIGGIDKENLKPVMDAGAVAVAVISAVIGAENIEDSARRMVNIIDGE